MTYRRDILIPYMKSVEEHNFHKCTVCGCNTDGYDEELETWICYSCDICIEKLSNIKDKDKENE